MSIFAKYTLLLGLLLAGPASLQAELRYANPEPGRFFVAEYDSTSVVDLYEYLDRIIGPEAVLKNQKDSLLIQEGGEVFSAWERPSIVNRWEYRAENGTLFRVEEDSLGNFQLVRLRPDGEQIAETNFTILSGHDEGLLGIELRHQRYYLLRLSFPVQTWLADNGRGAMYRVHKMSNSTFRVWKNTTNRQSYGLIDGARVLSQAPKNGDMTLLMPNKKQVVLAAYEQTLQSWSGHYKGYKVLVERTDKGVYRSFRIRPPDTYDPIADFKIIDLKNADQHLRVEIEKTQLSLPVQKQRTRIWVSAENPRTVGKYFLWEKDGRVRFISRYAADGAEQLYLDFQLIEMKPEHILVRVQGQERKFELPQHVVRRWSARQLNGDIIWASRMNDGQLLVFRYPHQLEWKALNDSDYTVTFLQQDGHSSTLLRVNNHEYRLIPQNKSETHWEIQERTDGKYLLTQKIYSNYSEYHFRYSRNVATFGYDVLENTLTVGRKRYAPKAFPRATKAFAGLVSQRQYVVNIFPNSDPILLEKRMGVWAQTKLKIKDISAQKITVMDGEQEFELAYLAKAYRHWKVLDFTASGQPFAADLLLPAQVALPQQLQNNGPYRIDDDFRGYQDRYYQTLSQSIFKDATVAWQARLDFLQHNPLHGYLEHLPRATALSPPIKKYLVNSYPFGFHYIDPSDYADWGYHVAEDSDTAAGTQVSAIGDGLVVYAAMHRGSLSGRFDYKQNYGGVVVVAHKFSQPYEFAPGLFINYFYSLSAHIEQLSVSRGQRVWPGQKLGQVATGYTPENGLWREEHLHFGIFLDPQMRYFWQGFGILPGYDRPGRLTGTDLLELESKFTAAVGPAKYRLWRQLSYQHYLDFSSLKSWRPGKKFIAEYAH